MSNLKTSLAVAALVLAQAAVLQGQQVYECVGKVFKFAAGRAREGEAGNNALCTCGVEGVTFGGEQAGGTRPATFYFRVGDDSMFSMTQAEFTEIMSVMNTAKRQWSPRP